MNDKPAGAKDFTLTGSVDEQQKLTLKVNVPSVMGGLTIEFIQGTLPISYHVSGTYNKEANLSVSVGSTTYPDITDCKVSIKRSSDDTVELAGIESYRTPMPLIIMYSKTCDGSRQAQLALSDGHAVANDLTLT